MNVRVSCPTPACGKSALIPDSYLGKSVRCRGCFTLILVGGSTTTADDGSPLGYTLDDGKAAATPAPKPSPPVNQSKSAEHAIPAAAPTELKPPQPVSRPVGATLGRFEILSKLGSGAFGTVYRARDPQLDRDVALKVPHDVVLTSPLRVERFLREAKAAAGLRHPNIVPVYDSGRADGKHFIASAFIAGKPLDDLVDEKGLDCRRAAEIVRKVAEGLAYAHARGIVHRDIKPANILVENGDNPQIADFGLAARGDDESRLTNDGAILGTPSYMAPEQAAGQQGQAKPAADQYSLGITLYELLTGHTPFSGPPAVVIHNQIHTAPEPPTKARADLPRDLETVCLKAIAKRPEDRYPDCQALADDLRRWLEGEPVQARRLGFVERSVRWVRREPKLAAALGTVLLLLTALGGLLSVKLRETILERDVFRDQATNAELDRDKTAADAEAARLAAEAARLDDRLNTAAATAADGDDATEKILAEIPLGQRGPDWGFVAMKARRAPEFGRLLNRLPPAAGGTVWLGFHGANPRLLGLGADRSLTDWDVWTGAATSWGKLAGKLPAALAQFGPAELDRSVLVSADGKRVVVVKANGEEKEKEKGRTLSIRVSVFDAETGDSLRDWTIDGFWPVSAVNADGTRVAIAYATEGMPYRLGVWDVATGERLAALDKELVPLPLKQAVLAFSPDGATLAATTAFEKGEIRAWSVPAGEEVMLVPNTGLVSQLSFSADGQRLAAVGGAELVHNTNSLVAWQRTVEVEKTVTHTKTVPITTKEKIRKTLKATDGKDCEVEYEVDVVKMLTEAVNSTVKELQQVTEPRPGPWLSPKVSLTTEYEKRAMTVTELKTVTKKIEMLRKGKRTVDGKVEECECKEAIDVTVCEAVPVQKEYEVAKAREWRDGEGLLRVWDRPTNALTFRVEESVAIEAIAWRADGLRLASAIRGNKLSACDSLDPQGCPDSARSSTLVKLWNSRTARLLTTLDRAGSSAVSCLAWSGDGIHLAAGFREVPEVACWSAESKQLIATRFEHEGPVYDLTFSPDGKLLASFGKCSDRVRLWDGDTAAPVRMVGPTRESTRFGDGKFFVTGTPRLPDVFPRFGSQPPSIWNRETGAEIRWPNTHILAAAPTPDGALIVTRASSPSDIPRVGEPPAVQVRDAETGRVVSTLDGSEGQFGGEWAMPADGKYVLHRQAPQPNTSPQIVIWNAATGQRLIQRDVPRAVAIAPDGSAIAMVSLGQKAELLILDSSGAVVASIAPDVHTQSARSLEYVGTNLILAHHSLGVSLYDVGARKLLFSKEFSMGVCAISPDGQRLAVLLGQMNIPNPPRAIPIEEMTMTWAKIQVVEIPTGKLLRELKVQHHMIVDLAFSPDGKLLASCGHTGPQLMDGMIDLYTVDKGERIASFRGHTRTVKRIAFRPDGQVLASAGSDRTVRLWRVPAIDSAAIPDDPPLLPYSPPYSPAFPSAFPPSVGGGIPTPPAVPQAMPVPTSGAPVKPSTTAPIPPVPKPQPTIRIEDLEGERAAADAGRKLKGTVVVRNEQGVESQVPADKPLPAESFAVREVWLKDVSLTKPNEVNDLLKSKELLSLNLNGCQFGDEVLRALGTLRLVRLNLQGSQLNERHVSDVAAIKSLERLSIQWTGRGTDQDCEKLSALENLKALTVNDCPITHKGCAAIARMKGLEEFYATGTKISGPDFARLNDLQKLKVLNLHKANVTDADLARLTMPSLESLSIEYTPITAKGIKELTRFTKLKQLVVDEKQLSRNEADTLRKALPGCEIVVVK